MKVLALDTSAQQSAACIWDAETGTLLSEDTQDIGRGHAEVLMGQIISCLDKASLSFSDIDRVVCARGPGSFTGVRVGLAAARGLGLGLGVPVVGVSCLDACEATARMSGGKQSVACLMDAKRHQVYCKHPAKAGPWLEDIEEISAEFFEKVDAICGSAASSVIRKLDISFEVTHELSVFPIEVYARLGSMADPSKYGQEPLYLRSADAKPQTGNAIPLQGV